MRTRLLMLWIVAAGNALSLHAQPSDLFDTRFPAVSGTALVDSFNSRGTAILYDDMASAHDDFADALTLAQSLSYTAGIAQAYNNLGIVALERNDFSGAVERFRNALAALDGEEVSEFAGWLYDYYGNALHRAGDKIGAANAYDAGLQIFTARGDTMGMAVITNHHALMNMRTSDYDSALVYYGKAQQYYLAVGNEQKYAAMLNSVGAAKYQMGLYQEALEHYIPALEIRERLNDTRGMSLVLNNIGLALQDMDKIDEAAGYFQRGLAYARELGDNMALGYTLHNLGMSEELRGNLSEALNYYEESENYRRLDDDPVSLTQTLNAIGAAAAKLDNFQRAHEVLDESIQIATQYETREGLATGLKNQGILFARQRQYARAEASLTRSIALAREIGKLQLEYAAGYWLSEMYIASGDFQQALESFQQATAIQDSLFNIDATKNIDRMRILYESEQKEQENLALLRERADQEILLQRNRIIIFLSSLFLGMGVVFLGVLYRMYQAKKQANVDLAETNRQVVEQRDEIEVKNRKLEDAITEIRTLSGLLPICANCKKIRDDKGYWQHVEKYITVHSDAEFTHGICPECTDVLYPGYKRRKDG